MNAGSPNRLRPWLRGVLVGPVSLIVASLVMAGGAVWLPEGDAKVNNLVLPVVLFPLLWTATFLYTCLDKKLTRAYAVMGALSAVNAALIAWHLMK
jgi:membrane-anchored glycerophosphoryl diester phosphodiesterase (GDPDase)